MDNLFEHLFVLTASVAEKIIRPIVVYFFLLAGFRLAGKRELAQLNQMDLVVLLLISNTVQNAIIGEDNSLIGGIIGAITLLCVNYIVVRLLYRHPTLDRLVEGDPDTLIENGRVLKDRLDAELITPAELLTAAHKQGFASLEEVSRAVLEPGGTITFTARKPEPDTRRHEELVERLEQFRHELAMLRTTIGGERA